MTRLSSPTASAESGKGSGKKSSVETRLRSGVKNRAALRARFGYLPCLPLSRC